MVVIPRLAVVSSNPGRSLREEQTFKDSVKQLGGAETVDVALSAIIDGLSNRPEGFDPVPGYGSLRIAKTIAITRVDGTVFPALRVWFSIHDETTVSLLYVEKIPDDEG